MKPKIILVMPGGILRRMSKRLQRKVYNTAPAPSPQAFSAYTEHFEPRVIHYVQVFFDS